MKYLSVLVVDDEKPILDVISLYLESMDGIKVLKAGTPTEALAVLGEGTVDLAVIDIKLPEMSGLELLKKVKQLQPDTEVIMISGHGDMQTVIECMRYGAIDYFSKPFELKALHLSMERSRKFITLRRELKQADSRMSELSRSMQEMPGQFLIGNGPRMQEIKRDLETFAQVDDQPVLITGDTGTGKEVAAKHLHNLSARRDKGFFAFNCAAIPESLFESELFGYKKGAFSGADHDKPGWFEIADRGTLFLDEVADMPVNLQAKLLRVLEEKKVWKLGAVAPVDVNVRVIAATNQNIQAVLDKGKFRADLYYRLNILEINMPALRNHKEDIRLLTEWFVKQFATAMKKKVPAVAPGVYKALENYEFPGNVRQLRNMVERAVILCNERTIELSHISIPGTETTPPEGNAPEVNVWLDLNLEAHEKTLIERALEVSGYNKTKAAQKLGVSLQSLLRRMEKFNIDQNEKYNREV